MTNSLHRGVLKSFEDGDHGQHVHAEHSAHAHGHDRSWVLAVFTVEYPRYPARDPDGEDQKHGHLPSIRQTATFATMSARHATPTMKPNQFFSSKFLTVAQPMKHVTMRASRSYASIVALLLLQATTV